MIHRRIAPSLILFLGLITQATAGDGFCEKLFSFKDCWPNCVGIFTCNDYDAKCAPCPMPTKCFTCDDYCPKCSPLAKPAGCFTCDDYCPKPFRLCCPTLLHMRAPPTCQAETPCP